MPAAEEADPWYESVEGEDLLQGDSLERCPVFLPPEADVLLAETENVAATVDVYDVIVVSHSCDLVEGKINSVLVCALSSLERSRRHYPPSIQRG